MMTGSPLQQREPALLTQEHLTGHVLPMVTGGALTVAATVRGSVGLAGGVVSIPLSSIIFSALYLHLNPQYSCSKT